MSVINISSNVEILDKLPYDYPEYSVKDEPMLFNNDFEHAWKQGGTLTRDFLRYLPNDWQNVPPATGMPKAISLIDAISERMRFVSKCRFI